MRWRRGRDEERSGERERDKWMMAGEELDREEYKREREKWDAGGEDAERLMEGEGTPVSPLCLEDGGHGEHARRNMRAQDLHLHAKT